MNISAIMANLQKCSRCKSTIDISLFGMNRRKQPYKTCDNCGNKNDKTASSDDNVSTTTPDTDETCDADLPTIGYKLSIPIDATDVAVLLGLNKYRTNLHELVMKYWKRGSPTSFQGTKSNLEKKVLHSLVLKQQTKR